MENSSNRNIVVAAIVIVIAFGLLVVFFWSIGLFDFSGTDASAKIVAASLALVGGLFASSITLVGIILRQSLERRNAEIREQTEKRLLIETERESRLKHESEQRLKIEAAIEAMKLLASSKGSKTQNAGVLFTLASLEMYDLAVTMLGKMLPDEEVTPDTASWLINRVMELDDEGLQLDASLILQDHSENFLTEDGGFEWPRCFVAKWNPEYPQQARVNAAYGILNLLLARQWDDWKRDQINSIIVNLASIWRTETLSAIRSDVGYSLKIILTIYSQGITVIVPSGEILIDDLKSEVSSVNGADTLFGEEIAKKYKKWMPKGKLF